MAVSDKQALEGFKALCETEGIIPALEPAHAIGYLLAAPPAELEGKLVMVNLSGRGDKDMGTVAEAFEVALE